jgi:hypothetical protein
MAEKQKIEFFLLRYVPNAVRGESVNIGVLMVEDGANGAVFADMRVTKDWRRVQCVDPQVDLEVIEALLREIRSEVGQLRDRAMLLRRMEDSFSGVIQLSEPMAVVTENPAVEIETMASMFVDEQRIAAKRVLTGRQRILSGIRDAWEQAGVAQMVLPVPVEPYTRPGDPFAFDFGYRVGAEIKLFHAVSLKAGVDAAVTLAARYPKIAPLIAQKTESTVSLTAVTEDGVDRSQEAVGFALGMMEEERIRVAALAEMPAIAEMARRELGV